jgi:hypothetical protein
MRQRLHGLCAHERGARCEQIADQPITCGSIHRKHRLTPRRQNLTSHCHHAAFVSDRLRARGITRLARDIGLVAIKLFGAAKLLARGFRGRLGGAQVRKRSHQRSGIEDRGGRGPLARDIQHLHGLRLDAEVLALL